MAWCSDISKVYNMLKLKDEALPYSLLLFHESLDEAINPDVYVMTAAWYGVSSTGNQANVAVDRLWMANQHELPEAAGPLGPDRYMDDVDSGADTREQVDVQVEQVRECLSRGGFKPKFVAYSGEPPSEAASADGRTVGVLGMRWDTERDTLSLGFGQMNIEKKVRGAKKPSKRDLSTPEEISAAMEEGAITRRKILGRAAEFYDPLGLFEPVKLCMKLLLSEMNHIPWDSLVPKDLQDKWVNLLIFMEAMPEVDIPRCMRPQGAEKYVRLLCFADAGEMAGG